MRFEEITHLQLVNETDGNKVSEIAQSMRKNGYVGCPLLFFGEQLLIGSHRFMALEKLSEEDMDVLDWDVAEDVTDLVNERYIQKRDELGEDFDIDFRNIGWILEGTQYEQYKDEITEW